MIKIEFSECEVEKYRGLVLMENEGKEYGIISQAKYASRDLGEYINSYFKSFIIAGQEWRFLYDSKYVKSRRIRTSKTDRTVITCRKIICIMNIFYCI